MKAYDRKMTEQGFQTDSGKMALPGNNLTSERAWANPNAAFKYYFVNPSEKWHEIKGHWYQGVGTWWIDHDVYIHCD